MKISMIDYTGAGTPDPASYAANVLIFTKSTRLQMSPKLMTDIQQMSFEEKLTELEYMANTIPSSWEFCNYTFLIEGVTRAFTHQLVRTRTASFAQQTMRVLNVDGWDYGTGPSVEGDNALRCGYEDTMKEISEMYEWLIDKGAKIEDARGILPTNIHTNIVMGCNLRTLTETIRKRSSPRTQGEYREFLTKLKEAIIHVHPWTVLFFDRSFEKASQELDGEIQALNISAEDKIKMIKLVDQMRKEV